MTQSDYGPFITLYLYDVYFFDLSLDFSIRYDVQRCWRHSNSQNQPTYMAGSGMAYMSVTPPGSTLTFSFRKLDLVLPVRVETPCLRVS